MPDAPPPTETTMDSRRDEGAWAELERGIHAALETYSNVHRGSGHASQVSTHLYEEARTIVLEHLGLRGGRHVVVFATPRRAAQLAKQLPAGRFQVVSSEELGLPLGVRALAIERGALPRGVPFQTGGGTTKLVSRNWAIWADGADRFEAGTPAIVNVLALAKALKMIAASRQDLFHGQAEATPAPNLRHDALDALSGKELLAALRRSLVGRDLRVPTAEGLRPFTQLDNSASTPTFEPIWQAFRGTWRQPEAARRDVVQQARAICAEALHAPAPDYELVFTSNTTEAINLVAESLGREAGTDGDQVIVNTLLEHSSNDLPWRNVPGHALVRLQIDANGFVDLPGLEALLRAHGGRVRLVAVSGASNVLGVCNDLAEIGRIAHQHGARVLVDAAQLVAHRSIDVERLGIDYLAFSAHKVYAPFGCGVLVARKGLLRFDDAELAQLHASGEENAGGVAALGKALVLLRRVGMDLVEAEERELTARLLRGLAKIPGVTLYGIQDPESAAFAHKVGVVAFALDGMMAPRVGRELAERSGIGIRAGCHCAHLLIKHLVGIGPFLEQFQRAIQTVFPSLKLPGVARVSLGLASTGEDVDALLRAVEGLRRKPQAESVPAAEVKRQMAAFVEAAALRVYAQPS